MEWYLPNKPFICGKANVCWTHLGSMSFTVFGCVWLFYSRFWSSEMPFSIPRAFGDSIQLHWGFGEFFTVLWPHCAHVFLCFQYLDYLWYYLIILLMALNTPRMLVLSEFYRPRIFQTTNPNWINSCGAPSDSHVFPPYSLQCPLFNSTGFQTTRCLQNAATAKLILSQATLLIKGTNQINQHLPFIKTATATQKYCFTSEHSFYNTGLAGAFYRDKESYNQSRRMHDVRFSWSCRWEVSCNQRKEGLWHHCCRAGNGWGRCKYSTRHWSLTNLWLVVGSFAMLLLTNLQVSPSQPLQTT